MDDFINYIEQEKEKLQQQENSLIACGRKDEADFIKIKSNILDICLSFYKVSKRQAAKENLTDNYLERCAMLLQNWTVQYDQAKEHKDSEKALKEEIKIETMTKANQFFCHCQQSN